MILRLTVKAATSVERGDADDLRVPVSDFTLLLEQPARARRLIQGSAVMYVREREIALGSSQTTGKRDGVAAARATVNSDEHILEHHYTGPRLR